VLATVPSFEFGPLGAATSPYVSWFNEHRPHQGIGQRTPDEVHFGRDTKPRAVPLRGALAATLIDGDRALPVIRLLDAA
jgi:hypothetical protein